jgi:bacteriocin biosynthesis cyclodehydratase domain-containing protein
VLEYGQSVVVLEGAGATSLLPSLLPLLDGTRTYAELADGLGSELEPALGSALSLLARHGLLTEGPPPTSWLPPARAGTVSVLVATAGGRITPSRAFDALEAARVVVVGSSALADETARCLRLSGIDRIERIGWGCDPEALADLDLALVAPSGEEVPLLCGWNALALATGVAWLQLPPFDGRLAPIGPLYIPWDTCCFECFRHRRAAIIDWPEEYWELERTPSPYPAAPAIDRMIAGAASWLALRWLAWRDPFVPGVLHALEHAGDLTLTTHVVYRVPRCPACSSARGLGAPLPWYEQERHAAR